jgi:large subunit ribosomal protein L25
MSKKYALSAQKRDQAGKGVARALRRENQVPAVIYGDNKAPQIVALNLKDLTLTYQTGVMQTGLCDLDVEGAKNLVLARDVQRHPVSDRIIHVDFMRVGPKTEITVAVPVHFADHDLSPGLKLDKGVLTVIHHEIELICVATKIPEFLEISLKDKKIGDALKLSSVQLPDGVKAQVGMEDETIATVAAPTVYVEAVVAAEAAATPDAAAAGAAGATPAAAAGAKAPAAAAGAKAPAAGAKDAKAAPAAAAPKKK